MSKPKKYRNITLKLKEDEILAQIVEKRLRQNSPTIDHTAAWK